MSFFSRFKKGSQSTASASSGAGSKKRRWVRIGVFFLVLLVIAGGVVFFKASWILNKISTGHENMFTSLIKTLPGVGNQLQGEKEGKINILLLGMRGENVPGGGTLADTIMVFSLHPSQKDGDPAKASLISVPRDLYVTDPVTNNKSKINAVYAYGEQRDHGKGGMEDMQKVVGEVTGLPISYSIVINFQGFIDLVNAMGGVTVHLDEPFSESQQFHEPQVCDSYTYTVPTKSAKGLQMYECKYSTKQAYQLGAVTTYSSRVPAFCENLPNSKGYYRVKAQYPLCYNHDEECGGDFALPAGDNTLDGAKALCYARSRYTSSDFERARRQQQVIQLIKDKALSAGTLTDFTKVNAVLNSLGDNVRTNLEVSEMKHLFDLYQKNQNPALTQKVLEANEEGLLYHPPETPETGYILLPLGDNYDRIHALFQSLP